MSNEENTTPETDSGEKLSKAKKTLALVIGALAIVGSIVIGRGSCRPSPKPPADAAAVMIDAAPDPEADAGSASDAAVPEGDAAVIIDASAAPVIDAAP